MYKWFLYSLKNAYEMKKEHKIINQSNAVSIFIVIFQCKPTDRK